MKNKLTYTEAVNLLAAFLGTDIMVEKPASVNYFSCRVSRMCKIENMQYEYKLIAERQSWEEVLDSILPMELKEHGKRIDYRAIGIASRLYQYRYIGKTLQRHS